MITGCESFDTITNLQCTHALVKVQQCSYAELMYLMGGTCPTPTKDSLKYKCEFFVNTIVSGTVATQVALLATQVALLDFVVLSSKPMLARYLI